MEFLNTSNSESIFNFNDAINDKDDIMNLDNSFLSDYSFDIFKSNFKINVIIFKDTETYINDIQEKLSSLYYNFEFDEIINYIENNFKPFSILLNVSFIYMIQKLKFFTLIKEGKINDAISHYKTKLLDLLKKVKSNHWMQKNKYFEKLIKKPNLFSKVNILKKYYDKFLYEIDKVVRNYFENKEQINNSFDLKKIYNNNNNCFSSEENSFENLSTKDEFSDFEDEFKPKISDENNINEYNNNDNNLNEINTGKNTFKIKIIFSLNLLKKNDNKPQIIFNQLPFLSSFKPNYTKRELLDKKILRSFRKYVIETSKKKNYGLIEKLKDNSFLILFTNLNILPPVNYTDVNTGEKVLFKSFNSQYLFWLFNKEGIKEIYFNFIKDEGKNLIEEISRYYDVQGEDKAKLIYYVENLPNIFNMNYVYKVTNGEYFNHIYRLNKVNVRKKDLIENNKNYHLDRSRDGVSENLDKSSFSDD